LREENLKKERQGGGMDARNKLTQSEGNKEERDLSQEGGIYNTYAQKEERRVDEGR
jgi:hypothetical protein